MSTADRSPVAVPRIEGPPVHLLLVQAPYHVAVVDGLRAGAARALEQAGASFDVLTVAGALELPGAIRLAVRAVGTGANPLEWGRRFDGFVALGCVVRGETDHYEFISREAMAGLVQVTLQYGLCVGVGLLTVDHVEQALARATADGPNKGAEAAVAALLQIQAARWLGAV